MLNLKSKAEWGFGYLVLLVYFIGDYICKTIEKPNKKNQIQTEPKTESNIIRGSII